MIASSQITRPSPGMAILAPSNDTENALNKNWRLAYNEQASLTPHDFSLEYELWLSKKN
jgi:hypothetical protein